MERDGSKEPHNEMKIATDVGEGGLLCFDGFTTPEFEEAGAGAATAAAGAAAVTPEEGACATGALAGAAA